MLKFPPPLTVHPKKISSSEDLLADKKRGFSLTRRPYSDSSIADRCEQISKPIEDEKSAAEIQKVQPLDNGSEFLTDNQLADLIELARASLCSSGQDYASYPPASRRLIHIFQQIIHPCSLDTCSNSQASEAVTEIDDLCQLSLTGIDDRKEWYRTVNEVYVGDSIS